MGTSDSKIRERVVAVMATVLELPAAQITDRIALGTTQNWDSMRHMNLILALEDELGVAFADDEVVEMISLPLIVEIVSAKQPAN